MWQVFNGIFNELTSDEAAALLSCFVHKEQSQEVSINIQNIRPVQLQDSYKKLQEIARNVAKTSIEAKIEMEEEEYLQGFCPDLMQVTYEWARGAKFSDVCKITEIFEGKFISIQSSFLNI